jgi:phosphinothricin acetyltransferase
MAAKTDSENILKIYAPFITDTAISFETEVPSVDDFSDRIERIIKNYPYIVYEIDDEIVGYAYASKHAERAAYLFDVELSIYVMPEFHGSGAANKLYECLFVLLKKMRYKNAYACYTEPNPKSKKFHQKFGFTVIGTHHKTGYKFGQWHDVTWLEKTIGKHEEKPEKPLSINDLSPEYINDVFNLYQSQN